MGAPNTVVPVSHVLPRAACAGAGAASGHYMAFTLQVPPSGAAIVVDEGGGFLLQSITTRIPTDPFERVLASLSLRDRSRNRTIFRDASAGIFPRRYSGACGQWARPVWFPMSSIIEFQRNDEVDDAVVVTLHGWRYRGDGEGPSGPPPGEEFYIYSVPYGQNLLTDADSEFICTQVLVPEDTDTLASQVQETVMLYSDRMDLFRGPLPIAHLRGAVGALGAIPEPWRFPPRWRVRVERVRMPGVGDEQPPLPLAFVGYKRYTGGV